LNHTLSRKVEGEKKRKEGKREEKKNKVMSTVRASSTARRRPRRNTKAEPLEIVDPKTFVWPERSRKNFVQLVALQCLLNPIPARRPVQPVDQTADSREKRGGYKSRLPPKVERDLTEHFAFLVAAGAGGTACCVEEEYVIDVGSTLRFRVAMNDGVPQWILDGLRGVCAEISKLANGGKELFFFPSSKLP
jgi:hypothetical protein